MLSLQEFDRSITDVTYSGMSSRIREHVASTILEFRAQPNETLPAFIASFAHPVHIDVTMAERDPDAIAEDRYEGREVDMVGPTSEVPSSQGPGCGQTSGLEPCV